MFENSRMLPWQRRQLKERVSSLSIIRRGESPPRDNMQGLSPSMTHDWGFELEGRKGQMTLPWNLPPAA